MGYSKYPVGTEDCSTGTMTKDEQPIWGVCIIVPMDYQDPTLGMYVVYNIT